MNVTRIIEMNKILNESKDEFELFRTKLISIFRKCVEFYKQAAHDMDFEIRDSILEDAKSYERLMRLAKSGKPEDIKKAWLNLDIAPRETVYDIMNSQEKKQFNNFIGKK